MTPSLSASRPSMVLELAYWVFCSNRILLFPLSVCLSVSVTSLLFSIIWWFRAWKPYILWKHIIQADHPDHSYHLTTWTTLTSLITWTIGTTGTVWTTWTTWTTWTNLNNQPLWQLQLIKRFIKINAEFALFLVLLSRSSQNNDERAKLLGWRSSFSTSKSFFFRYKTVFLIWLILP